MAKKQEVSPRKPKTAATKAAKGAKPVAGVVAEKKPAKAAASDPRGLSTAHIGETAGDVWRILAERGSQTVASLKKSIDAPDDVVLLALGWLAREDKLAFEASGRSVTVSLR